MVEVCGVKYMKGFSKKSGKPYEAYLLYFTEDGKPQGVTGYVTGDAFVSVNLFSGRVPAVGDKLTLYYDKRGFISGLEFED